MEGEGFPSASGRRPKQNEKSPVKRDAKHKIVGEEPSRSREIKQETTDDLCIVLPLLIFLVPSRQPVIPDTAR